MKKALLHVIFLSVAVLTLNACSTVAGAGKDIKKAGQAIEHQAEKI